MGRYKARSGRGGKGGRRRLAPSGDAADGAGPGVAAPGPRARPGSPSATQAAITASSMSATMLVILISGFTAGPEVSL